MRFNGAIFDVDGVLVDSPHEQAWRQEIWGGRSIVLQRRLLRNDRKILFLVFSEDLDLVELHGLHGTADLSDLKSSNGFSSILGVGVAGLKERRQCCKAERNLC